MKAALLFAGSGRLVILTSHGSLTDAARDARAALEIRNDDRDRRHVQRRGLVAERLLAAGNGDHAPNQNGAITPATVRMSLIMIWVAPCLYISCSFPLFCM